MFFGICFSGFNAGEVISTVDGATIDDIIEGFEADDVEFDSAFDNGQILIIEGNPVTLRQTTRYEVKV